MNIFKRSLSALLVLVMIVTAVPMGAIAVSAETTNGEYIYVDVPATAVIDIPYEMAVFYFCPEVSGYYTFCSNSDADTYGYLCDSNGDCLDANDDGGNNANFSIGYNLDAGETYELHVRFYDRSCTGEIPVIVALFPVVSVECEPITIIENCNGEWRTYYDGNESIEYFSYYSKEPIKYVVTMSDGTVIEGENGSALEYNGVAYNFT